eukprot:scaffold2751_cov344-Prasinococcus_capsulatus_cf.AAC.12
MPRCLGWRCSSRSRAPCRPAQPCKMSERSATGAVAGAACEGTVYIVSLTPKSLALATCAAAAPHMRAPSMRSSRGGGSVSAGNCAYLHLRQLELAHRSAARGLNVEHHVLHELLARAQVHEGLSPVLLLQGDARPPAGLGEGVDHGERGVHRSADAQRAEAAVRARHLVRHADDVLPADGHNLREEGVLVVVYL